MSPQTQQSLLKLPREIRDVIYGFVFSERLEFSPEFYELKRTSIPKRPSPTLLKLSKHGAKQRAYLFDQDDGASGRSYVLISTAALAQANRQIRAEFSDFLNTGPIDVVTRVHNFNFGHVIKYLQSIRAKKAEAFDVAVDGIFENLLTIELMGPYDVQAIPNLTEWTRAIGMMTDSDGELAISHKTIGDRIFPDPLDCASPKFAEQLWVYYQRYIPRPGSIELHKVFVTMYARYRAELMLALSYGTDFLGHNI